MKLKYFILICLLFTQTLFADEDTDPIVVRLATDSPLTPAYLVPMLNEQSDYPDTYLKQLDTILSFDLNHNGATYTVKRTDYVNHLATSGSFEQIGSLAEWKAQNVSYAIKTRVRGNTLSALILNLQNHNLKSATDIPLTGDFAQDRRQIHKLADTIHKALFGTDGIASTRILYSVKTQLANGKALSEIWEADYDGANARQLTSGGHYCITPTYLPPKPGYTTGGFMYVSYEIGQSKIYIASLKDGMGQRLTYLKGNQLMPAISQQRDRIAFISDVTGNPDLFVQSFSPETGPLGKAQQVFSAKQATQGTPTFSPDGKKLAFVSNKDGSPKIYVLTIPEPGISLKDVKPTLISKRNRENSAPCWSPDGTKVAYCSRTSNERQIWMYDFETGQEQQLTQGAGNKENPSWAPNSLHLVFNSSDSNSSQLYLINLNQPDATQITFGKGEKRFPSWEPRFN